MRGLRNSHVSVCHCLVFIHHDYATSFDDRRRITQLDRRRARRAAARETQRAARAKSCRTTPSISASWPAVRRNSKSLDELASLAANHEGRPSAASRATSRSPPIARFRSRSTSAAIKLPAPAAGRWWCVDTADDWRWWIEAWQYVLDAAEVTPSDRALLAFSFGPFIGFWSAFDALAARGALVIPGGGLGSLARIELIRSAERHHAPLHADLRTAAGRSGGRAQDQPGRNFGRKNHRRRRARRQRAGHARAHRIGLGRPRHRPRRRDRNRPLGIRRRRRPRPARQRSCNSSPSSFPSQPAIPPSEGELSHLILTTLGRIGSPVIRYRTGDLVRPIWPTDGPNRFVLSRRRHPRPRRRHDDHPRHERLSRRRSSKSCTAFPKSSNIASRPASTARWTSSSSKSKTTCSSRRESPRSCN